MNAAQKYGWLQVTFSPRKRESFARRKEAL
jgi:hypothetical protein